MEINYNLDTLLEHAIHQALRNNITSIYRDSIRSNYFNRPPLGGYIVNEEYEYILPDRDDLSSTLLIDIVTQFGSPGNDSLLQTMKNHKREQLKTMKYHKVKETCETVCPICIEELKKGEYYRKLECNHVYHKKCIDSWFKKDHSDCPMCRKKILD
jgi:hypothetical protein